ncbi:unnamed protein product [Penicillium olsonii]|nr:unnamed protein product [Penicillium olsonii]
MHGIGASCLARRCPSICFLVHRSGRRYKCQTSVQLEIVSQASFSHVGHWVCAFARFDHPEMIFQPSPFACSIRREARLGADPR